MRRKTVAVLIAIFLLLLIPSGVSAAEKIGTVTISIEDFGVRIPGDSGEYAEPFGAIAGPAEIDIFEGDTIASVTLRWFNQQSIGYSNSGSVTSGFYLKEISNFTTKSGTAVPYLGEFDSGSQSGWMITLNNWFINQGASEFLVEDGDTIKWQYTCQLGKDIGNGFGEGEQTAEIKSLKLVSDYGTMSPAFSSSVKAYDLYILPSQKNVRAEAELVNAWSVVTYSSGGNTYKPNRDIPVSFGTQITIRSEYRVLFDDPVPVDTDQITLSIKYLGDMNSNGSITVTDLIAVRNYVLSGTGNGGIIGDFDRNGAVNIRDCLSLRSYILTH